LSDKTHNTNNLLIIMDVLSICLTSLSSSTKRIF